MTSSQSEINRNYMHLWQLHKKHSTYHVAFSELCSSWLPRQLYQGCLVLSISAVGVRMENTYWEHDTKTFIGGFELNSLGLIQACLYSELVCALLDEVTDFLSMWRKAEMQSVPGSGGSDCSLCRYYQTAKFAWSSLHTIVKGTNQNIDILTSLT